MSLALQVHKNMGHMTENMTQVFSNKNWSEIIL